MSLNSQDFFGIASSAASPRYSTKQYSPQGNRHWRRGLRDPSSLHTSNDELKPRLCKSDISDDALCGEDSKEIGKKQSLTDGDALDVEDQVRVGRDVRRCTLLAVCHRGGDGEATLAASGHASDTDIPALDDLANTELEGKRLALLIGCVVISMMY
jgi:hypothetical protein